MGRFTQRRRASTSPGEAAAPPPSGVAILSVVAQVSPGQALITFDTVVVFTSGFYADSQFSIAGNPVSVVNTIPSSPSSTVLVNVTGFWSAGSTWDVIGQPSWLTDAILSPQTGAVA